ncbi:Lysophosphatidic acid receptor 1-A [Plecturocebus cupreus]
MFNTGPNTQRLKVSTWLLPQGLIDNSLMASVANLLTIAIDRHITVFCMQLHTWMSNWPVVVVIVQLLVFWAIFNLVTFVVMVVLCAHIFGYVCQRTMRMSRHSSGPQCNPDAMMSLLKTVVIVLGAFIICWTSELVLLILDVCYPQCNVLAYEKFFLLLAEFNSAMNLII